MPASFSRVVRAALCLVLATAMASAAETIPKPGAKPDAFKMPDPPPAGWLTYHLAHPGPGGTFPADPDCAMFWKGAYHLHYIFQRGPHNHCWAHVVSPDMVHWTWRPTPLTTDNTGHGMFSGGSFITKDGRPAIIYHGLGSGFNQISIATDDALETWTKPVPMRGTAADGTPSKTKYWDPECWLDGDTYYAISGGKGATLFKSADLETWQEVGPLIHEAMPDTLGVKRDEDISCANMFKLGDKWMLLCISHGLGCRYYLGTWKDGRYLPDFHGRMNWRGQEVFAPESLLTPDGRRVMWAWLHVKGGKFQGGVQSLPRELSLPSDGVLRIKPLRELESLRGARLTAADAAVPAGAPIVLDGISGDALEVEAKLEPGAAATCGLRVLCDDKGAGGMLVQYDPKAGLLLLDDLKVPFKVPDGEPLTLRVFVDRTLVEVFANDRQAAAAVCKAPAGVRVALVADGGEAKAQGIGAWPLASAYAPVPKP